MQISSWLALASCRTETMVLDGPDAAALSNTVLQSAGDNALVLAHSHDTANFYFRTLPYAQKRHVHFALQWMSDIKEEMKSPITRRRPRGRPKAHPYKVEKEGTETKAVNLVKFTNTRIIVLEDVVHMKVTQIESVIAFLSANPSNRLKIMLVCSGCHPEGRAHTAYRSPFWVRLMKRSVRFSLTAPDTPWGHFIMRRHMGTAFTEEDVTLLMPGEYKGPSDLVRLGLSTVDPITREGKLYECKYQQRAKQPAALEPVPMAWQKRTAVQLREGDRVLAWASPAGPTYFGRVVRTMAESVVVDSAHIDHRQAHSKVAFQLDGWTYERVSVAHADTVTPTTIRPLPDSWGLAIPLSTRSGLATPLTCGAHVWTCVTPDRIALLFPEKTEDRRHHALKWFQGV